MNDEWVLPTSGKGQTVPVGAIEMYFDDQGQGDVVILLHGGIMDHQSWGNQIPELSKRYRVISPDTRGHGRSTDSDQPFSYELFVEDLKTLLTTIGVSKASFVGFSDGGCSSLLMALRYPEMVHRVVLIGTPYNTDNYKPGVLDGFASVTLEQFMESAGSASVIAELARKARGVSKYEASWSSMWTKLVNILWTKEPTLRLDELRTITAPTLILHGESEQYIEREASEQMAKAIPSAILVEILGANHSSPQQAPEFVNSLILDFLK